jgi:COMPASS component SWD1
MFQLFHLEGEDVASNIKSLENTPQKLKSIEYGVIQITFSKNGQNLVINCKSMIRLFHVISDESDIKSKCITKLVFLRDLKDVVNGSTFSMIGFSKWTGLGLDSEFVFGITGSNIYILDREHGSVIKLLIAHREQNYYVVSHLYKPIIASCTNGGFIYF